MNGRRKQNILLNKNIQKCDTINDLICPISCEKIYEKNIASTICIRFNSIFNRKSIQR